MFVFCGTSFLNLCTGLKSNACHGNENNYAECCLKTAYVSENARIKILPSFEPAVQTIDMDRSAPAEKESFCLFEIRPHLLNYCCLIKFINPSNAPPHA